MACTISKNGIYVPWYIDFILLSYISILFSDFCNVVHWLSYIYIHIYVYIYICIYIYAYTIYVVENHNKQLKWYYTSLFIFFLPLPRNNHCCKVVLDMFFACLMCVCVYLHMHLYVCVRLHIFTLSVLIYAFPCYSSWSTIFK